MAFAFRLARTEVAWIPYLLYAYYSKHDKEILKNAETVRNFARNLLNQRRNEKGYENHHDLLSILLSDEVFKDKDEEIIDECITFFIAGS